MDDEISLPKPVKSLIQRKRDRCAQTAAWRARTAHRPEPRVVDRAVLEAMIIALVDPSVVPPSVCKAVLEQVTSDAITGLERLGYDRKEAKFGIGRRLSDHRRDRYASVVKPAIKANASEHEQRRLNRPGRHGVAFNPANTRVTTEHGVPIES